MTWCEDCALWHDPFGDCVLRAGRNHETGRQAGCRPGIIAARRGERVRAPVSRFVEERTRMKEHELTDAELEAVVAGKARSAQAAAKPAPRYQYKSSTSVTVAAAPRAVTGGCAGGACKPR